MNAAKTDAVSRYLLTGSRQDYEVFVREWLPSIRRFLAVNFGNDLHACEEVQQEVLLSLMGNLSGFDGRSQFSTFLFSLVRHKAFDFMRREKRRQRLTVSLEQVETFDSSVFSSGARDDPLEILVRKATADRLLSLILKLPPKDRELLYFRELEELSVNECSAILKKTEGTVKTRLHRIKKKLYLQMADKGDRP